MQIGLFQKQTTKLTMTAELRQAIALIQYNTIDLLEFIQNQAIENPLIELEEPELEYQQGLDFHLQTTSKQNNHIDPIPLIAQNQNHLIEDLLEQIKYLKIDNEKRTILQYIILNLDDNGYLTFSTQELASQLNKNEVKIKTTLPLLHKLEPIGVGARNLKECLLLQAEHYFPEKPLIKHIIEHYLTELADKKWHDISQKSELTLTEVKQIAKAISTLNPRPYAGLFNNEPNYLLPDLTIKKENEEYKILLGDHFLPKIKINQNYLHLKNSHPQTSSYIQSKYNSYMWLMNSIEQRRTTMMKITNTVIKMQPGFLKQGFSQLMPMTLKEVANEINMHESTVSRAVSNKIICTPVGSFEMNKLFSSKLKKNGTDYASSAQVKVILKQLIHEEDRQKALSDQKLADKIKEENGITVSRRTIAKYREELNIPSSSKRKQII
ncbi:RNA polymerase factor sigma-54 [Cerasibacillus terrae]|uniref:RNA polymerase factor sigma-54 n=1 Tax=Cerasibacillus terrae TaxID=2498845 RepID=A0A5C8P2I3_9BACI|nr:RNA polymerase factor sigma-54 [Cerasibacillus terrae]TXL67497.1 RNA polymerase factor sigma-54 [Cerasibacillus terrae]